MSLTHSFLKAHAISTVLEELHFISKAAGALTSAFLKFRNKCNVVRWDWKHAFPPFSRIVLLNNFCEVLWIVVWGRGRIVAVWLVNLIYPFWWMIEILSQFSCKAWCWKSNFWQSSCMNGDKKAFRSFYHFLWRSKTWKCPLLAPSLSLASKVPRLSIYPASMLDRRLFPLLQIFYLFFLSHLVAIIIFFFLNKMWLFFTAYVNNFTLIRLASKQLSLYRIALALQFFIS